MGAQQRLKSAFGSAQSDKSPRFLHKKTLRPRLSKNAPSEDSKHCANTQADLNLRWAHMSEGTFSDAAAQIIEVHMLLVQHTCNNYRIFHSMDIDSLL